MRHSDWFERASIWPHRHQISNGEFLDGPRLWRGGRFDPPWWRRSTSFSNLSSIARRAGSVRRAILSPRPWLKRPDPAPACCETAGCPLISSSARP